MYVPALGRSSTEAEYRSVANCVVELIWIQQFFGELDIRLTSTLIIYCDNVSTTYLTLNPVFHARTKHIDLDVHFVHEHISTGRLHVQYVPFSDQLADILTKILLSSRHATLRQNLLVVTLNSN